MKKISSFVAITFLYACSSIDSKNQLASIRRPAEETTVKCSSLINDFLVGGDSNHTWPYDKHKKILAIDKKVYLNDVKSHKEVWRGLLEIHFSYLNRTVLTSKKSVWDLVPDISSVVDNAVEIRFLSLQSDSEDLVTTVIEPLRLNNEQFSASGTGNPLLRSMSLLSNFGPNALEGEHVSKEVFANTLIYKKKSGETYIGRMFLSKQLSSEEKREYYSKIAQTLEEMNAGLLVIEAADKIHSKLYQKMGFTLKNEVQGAYGEDTVYVLESTLDKFKEAFLKSSSSD